MTQDLTTTFDHILNWELKSGSHTFPGPSGGTCINEAAIVAAGFEYKQVGSAHDCPPCFSRVLATYAIGINDRMPDALRNELLMPFVTRLAGTADTPAVERARAEHIVVQTIRRLLPLALRAAGRVASAAHAAALATAADACATSTTLAEARAAAQAARATAEAAAEAAAAVARAAVARAAAWAWAEAEAAAAWAWAAAARAAAWAWAAAEAEAEAAAEAAAEAEDPRTVWTITAEILDGAMLIGRQPEPLDVVDVRQRMDAIRELARA